MINTVIYDLDDTLINTSEVLPDALVSVFDENKKLLNCSFDTFLSANTKSVNQLRNEMESGLLLHQLGYLVWSNTLTNLHIAPKPSLVLSLYESFQVNINSKLTAKNNILETLLWLKEKNITVCVLSNGNYIERLKKLQSINLLQYIDVLVSTDLIGFDKPNLKPFNYIVDLTKSKSRCTIFVGDSLINDIYPALSLGMTGILYSQGKTQIDKSYYSINNHIEIIPIISKINNLEF